MSPELDIRTAVLTAVGLSLFFAVIALIGGINSIFRGRHIPYFRMRYERIVKGWRQLLLFAMLLALAWVLNAYAEPAAYSFFPPSITPTLTSTITLTPTISQTPTISLTPSITYTPEVSNTPTLTLTPHIPLAIEAQFEGQLTPPADVIFSKLQFTNQGVDSLYRPIQPAEVFPNPVGQMFAYFTYDGMAEGTQWTALWYRDGELIHFETSPWQWGTGGAGFSEWTPNANDWLPGEYQVQMFIGLDWVVVGAFLVEGQPPTLTTTASVTASHTPTSTLTHTVTLGPSSTPSPSPSATPPKPSKTITPSNTPWPTTTPSVTPKPVTVTPSRTPIPTIPRWPTATRITPSATITRWPTPTKDN